MIDWIPIVFVIFKALVLGTGMFFAIKWHYDQDKKERRVVLRTGGKVAAVFVLLLLGLVLLTFYFSKKIGLDLTFP
jgi:Na+-driven multidrug efflux pump